VSGDRDKGFIFVPADLAEDVDLTAELKKDILFTHAKLGELDHWQLLGLPWGAAVEKVRDAYLDRVKVFHPDRHPGKRLGTFRARMEAIFRALTEARDQLVDPARREAYARKTAPPDERARQQVRQIEGEHRAVERRARLARQNPLLARATRVQEFMARGRAAFEQGNWQQAQNDFQMVVSLDERHGEARKMAEEARRKLLATRAADTYDDGLKAELSGQPQAAAAFFVEAAAADPQNGRFAVAAARALTATGDLEGARQQAERAVRLAPRDGATHEALALVLHASGQVREAKKEAERALELDPSREQARALVRKLRWNFLG
jgi:curved DNA-binding protein CbpA